MAEKRVLITHPDGREYSLLEEDFEKDGIVRVGGPDEPEAFASYKAAGFKIVGADRAAARREPAKSAEKDKE